MHFMHVKYTVSDGIVLAASSTGWNKSPCSKSVVLDHAPTQIHTDIHTTWTQKLKSFHTCVESLSLSHLFPKAAATGARDFVWVGFFFGSTINGKGRKDGRHYTTPNNSTRSLSPRDLLQNGRGVRCVRRYIAIGLYYGLYILCGLGSPL